MSKKTKFIGVFELGKEDVRVGVLPEEIGGSLYFFSEKVGPVIEVGIDEEKWSNVWEVLMHEAFEFCACRMGIRFSQTDRFSRSHADYTFIMNHEQMAEVFAMMAPFLCKIQLPLYQAWKKRKQ